MGRPLNLATIALTLCMHCDHGLVPPAEPPTGAISGSITYSGNWPAPDSIRDVRFVAMTFVPRDTTDIVRAVLSNELAVSPGLARRVESDSFFIDNVATGPYFYNGIAFQGVRSDLDWFPVGLYDKNDGILLVRANEVTLANVLVDFDNLPPFPPPENVP